MHRSSSSSSISRLAKTFATAALLACPAVAGAANNFVIHSPGVDREVQASGDLGQVSDIGDLFDNWGSTVDGGGATAHQMSDSPVGVGPHYLGTFQGKIEVSAYAAEESIHTAGDGSYAVTFEVTGPCQIARVLKVQTDVSFYGNQSDAGVTYASVDLIGDSYARSIEAGVAMTNGNGVEDGEGSQIYYSSDTDSALIDWAPGTFETLPVGEYTVIATAGASFQRGNGVVDWWLNGGYSYAVAEWSITVRDTP